MKSMSIEEPRGLGTNIMNSMKESDILKEVTLLGVDV